jgi:ATP-dependent DNA ligase
VQILTRRSNDWTDKYPAIAKAIAALPAQNAYLDGELCGVLPDGRTAFNLIQNATEGSLIFFLFDLLFPNGENLMGLPVADQRHDSKSCSRMRRTRSAITTTRSARDRPSTDWPANIASKASCRSASMAGMSLTGARG